MDEIFTEVMDLEKQLKGNEKRRDNATRPDVGSQLWAKVNELREKIVQRTVEPLGWAEMLGEAKVILKKGTGTKMQLLEDSVARGLSCSRIRTEIQHHYQWLSIAGAERS
jgi:hypothetical protein